MRQLLWAAGVACAVGAFAQQANAQTTMPGQVVGTSYNLSGVGQQLPKAAPAAGQPINLPAESPLMRRADLTRPLDAFKGTNLNASQIAAPVMGIGDQTILDRLYDKVKSAVGYTKPIELQQQSTYFPSLTRRNRERNEAKMWRRD